MKTSKPAFRLADSYKRFSSGRQQHGDSADRQNENFTDFCEKFSLSPNMNMIDKGCSAYHGKHRSKGHFGRYLALIESGQIEKGRVLVIDSWDRFSRAKIDIAFSTVCDILQAGVDIGVCDILRTDDEGNDTYGDIFTANHIDTDKIDDIYKELRRARRESKKKAQYGLRYHKNRRKKKLNTRVCPCWLVLNEATGQYDWAKEQVKVGGFNKIPAITLKKAIGLAISGMGTDTIIKELRLTGSECQSRHRR
jgi:hypothetical protein